ncbi:Rrf2 family transcriptional regulator [Robertkochia marina]|uniref:Rrf2 family transcriptional regulator n=1 Tax=Robertkochia marina TaxID=1227945 RepID=A0A4S3M204_9FLAO|nr:Rrf2 family transcriptional regulator [Robertkochia marina]THD69144.1 Rrf2 family transcriptional regulator [Robertkochia marina]TRZ47597.1 Rrf2 family transcriptional regulator [Robertkochia marina]
MFSKACEYGIKATIFIVSNSSEGKAVSLKEIADHINSPSAFTSKILQKLVKQKLIKSTRGTNGGFHVPENALKNFTLARIVTAIDGDSIYKGCGLGLEECDESRPCPLHHRFKSVRDNLQHLLETTSLEDLAKDLKKGNVFLKL